jgi:bifunctional DNA-binding transcriptional regulator/antitoxin component of YhaV-PrlF toxin-antitoxin module
VDKWGLDTLRKKISTNRYGQFYLPTDFRKTLLMPEDKESTFESISDTRIVVLMPVGMKAKEVLRSLDVIKKQLKNEEQDEERILNGTTN